MLDMKDRQTDRWGREGEREEEGGENASHSVVIKQKEKKKTPKNLCEMFSDRFMQRGSEKKTHSLPWPGGNISSAL